MSGELVDYICKVTLKKLSDQQIIKDEDIEVYHYGLELLIATIFKVLGIMIIATIFCVVKETIIFTMFFSGLRIQAGGYHAKTIMGCFINMIFLTFPSIILVKIIPGNYLLYYILFTIIISKLLVFIYAPVDTENKPLTKEEKIVYRSRSLITVMTGSIIALLAIYFKIATIYIVSIGLTGFLVESLTLVNISVDKE